MTEHNSPPTRVELRKYPNRRYYDATQRRQATLDDIHRLVREGCDVSVTDSKTGDDITSKVLAQIILEHDSTNLAVLPAELLHHVIRTSEPLFREFMETYFCQALRAFLESRRRFEDYMRLSLGLQRSLQGMNPAQAMMAWTQFLVGPPGGGATQAAAEPDGADRGGHAPSTQEELGTLSQRVADLGREMESLRRKLEQPSGPD